MTSPFDLTPNEIILLILREAIIMHTYSTGHVFAMQQSDIGTLWSVSRVCKRWREISLSDGRLWASINVDCHKSTKLVPELLRRAKTAPLAIHSGEREYNLRFFETLNWQRAFARVNSWESLSIRGSIDPNNSGPLLDALIKPAHKLELFQISNVENPYRDDINDDDFDGDLFRFVLPDNLFAGHAPCLRRFAVTNVSWRVSFDFSVWEQLTELHINQSFGDLQGNKISSRKWLEILRGTKQLEHLHIVWPYRFAFGRGLQPLYLSPAGSEPGQNFESVANVHLDHLLTLRLEGNSRGDIVLDIFSKLVVPDACTTTIHVSHDKRRELTFDRLSIGLNRRFMGWHAAHIPVHIHSRRGIMEFGFRLQLHSRSDNLGDYGFRFCYMGYYPEPDGGDVISVSADLTSPYSRMIEVLREARGFSSAC